MDRLLWCVIYREEEIKQRKRKTYRHRQQSGDYQREKGWGEVEEGTGGLNGVGRRLDLRWYTHNTMYRRCVIELYT